MARRNSNTDTASTEAEVTPTEGTEPEAQTTTTEAPAEAEVNIAPFVEAVEKAVAERDESTGVLSADVIESVNKVYRDLDGIKGKNAAKKSIEASMLDAVDKLDVQLARAYSQIKENLSAAGGSSTPKAPADPTQAYVQRMASLNLAAALVARPEGLAEDAADQIEKLVESLSEDVTKYQTWLTTEPAEGEEKPAAPEVSPVVRNAFKLATGKAAGGGRQSGGSGVRRDIAKHITQAFADKASGEFLTVAQIANFKSDEYGEDHPSQGAVSARLFPQSGKCTVEGVVPVDKTNDTPRGATKA